MISSGRFKDLIDELNLTSNIFPAYPTSLPLSDHVHGFVALNRSPCCLEFSKALLGVDAAFGRSVILVCSQNLAMPRNQELQFNAAAAPKACYNLRFVLLFTLALLAAVRVFFRSRRDIALEILALRHQVAVLKRKRPRPQLRPCVGFSRSHVGVYSVGRRNTVDSKPATSRHVHLVETRGS